MTELPPDFKPMDPGRVNVMDPIELRYWCRELQCSEERLQLLVERVGEHIAAVRDALERQG